MKEGVGKEGSFGTHSIFFLSFCQVPAAKTSPLGKSSGSIFFSLFFCFFLREAGKTRVAPVSCLPPRRRKGTLSQPETRKKKGGGLCRGWAGLGVRPFKSFIKLLTLPS